jgi:hypothetical protein
MDRGSNVIDPMRRDDRLTVFWELSGLAEMM